MKFKPGDEVVIVEDPLNYGLPLEHHAIVIKIDLNTLDFRNYQIRIPAKRSEHWVPEKCLCLASEINAKCVEEVLHNHLVDLALDKKDKALFDQVTNKRNST